jgi:hypothetical protein
MHDLAPVTVRCAKCRVSRPDPSIGARRCLRDAEENQSEEEEPSGPEEDTMKRKHDLSFGVTRAESPRAVGREDGMDVPGGQVS